MVNRLEEKGESGSAFLQGPSTAAPPSHIEMRGLSLSPVVHGCPSSRSSLGASGVPWGGNYSRIQLLRAGITGPAVPPWSILGREKMLTACPPSYSLEAYLQQQTAARPLCPAAAPVPPSVLAPPTPPLGPVCSILVAMVTKASDTFQACGPRDCPIGAVTRGDIRCHRLQVDHVSLPSLEHLATWQRTIAGLQSFGVAGNLRGASIFSRAIKCSSTPPGLCSEVMSW